MKIIDKANNMIVTEIIGGENLTLDSALEFFADEKIVEDNNVIYKFGDYELYYDDADLEY